jgi:hypothetical protein
MKSEDGSFEFLLRGISPHPVIFFLLKKKKRLSISLEQLPDLPEWSIWSAALSAKRSRQ